MPDDDAGLLLGRTTPVVEQYSPHVLYPMPRCTARQTIGICAELPFFGTDLWHAYELSWLDVDGRPRVAVGRFEIPASSPNIIESKSFKLYLNSLNNTCFRDRDALRDVIIADTSAVAGVAISLDVLPLDHPTLVGVMPPGQCVDDTPFAAVAEKPAAGVLQCNPDQLVEEQLYSHVLRSLCPVTGQPDWATLWVHYRGAPIEHASLLQYIASYRNHREFHEQCVERVFRDICKCNEPEILHVQAFYTRRGGLDINPFRSLDPAACPLPRMPRQ
ncbi:MAG: NADPH-dependent 7-cyano-7-deazaguanine reductase QueF [Halioglobus sp.]|nr:NADPH-dependent 7-cyano-7-deazaguanine reductase QueF [Halioglobus sp.]